MYTPLVYGTNRTEQGQVHRAILAGHSDDARTDALVVDQRDSWLRNRRYRWLVLLLPVLALAFLVVQLHRPDADLLIRVAAAAAFLVLTGVAVWAFVLNHRYLRYRPLPETAETAEIARAAQTGVASLRRVRMAMSSRGGSGEKASAAARSRAATASAE